MHVISRKTLNAFWQRNRDAQKPLEAWYKIASKQDWSSIQDVRRAFPHADAIQKDGKVYTCFNIAGNRYRLIVGINYLSHTIFIKACLRHKDYDDYFT